MRVTQASSPSIGVAPRPVARLERAGRGHQPSIESEQVGLAEGPLVGHRHPEQDLALALGVADGVPAAADLRATGGPRQLRPFVEKRHDAPVERVDLPSEAAELGGLGAARSSV